MSKPRILLIDDDETLISLLAEHLEAHQYQVETAPDGDTGLSLVEGSAPDLIVLDVMMPGMDGWQVLTKLRRSGSTPVVMLTAKDQEFDKLRAFHLGVDDYITKPFSFAELTARVGAVLSRLHRSAESPNLLTTGDLQIDFDRRRITRNGRVVELTPTEYRLLECLARTLDRPVASEVLVQQVWGSRYAGEVEHVKHYIWSLRRKLEIDPGDPQHVLTERGFGYRLV
ncbi:MAG TPA: response regulator transcription factor [Anaerolineales bacterium]|nr:response regulator transcription factor [Anaerolineales bacterium]